MKRMASAEWNGTLKEGQGRMKIQGLGFEGPYSFVSRFAEGEGTNPEELIAAAHAGCFSMAFSAELERAGFPPIAVRTTAHVHLEKLEKGFTITRIDLKTSAEVHGIDPERFQEIANSAKENCPVSRLLKTSAEIGLEAELLQIVR